MRNWSLLSKSLMWTGSVVIVNVFLEHTSKMTLVQDEQLIQAFLTNRADPAFGHGIGFRRSKGSTNNFKAFGDEDLVEAASKFTVAVMDEEAHGSLGSVI